MKTLINIVRESARRHGEETPLTLGHLLNILLMWERVSRKQRNKAAWEEEKNHREALEESSYHGQR